MQGVKASREPHLFVFMQTLTLTLFLEYETFAICVSFVIIVSRHRSLETGLVAKKIGTEKMGLEERNTGRKDGTWDW